MKVASIELLRGFAVSIVVLYHLYAVQVRYFSENSLPKLFLLGSWGVDIFFVISGVVMYKSFYSQREGMVWPFLRARIARIYPPYWAITLVIFTIAQFKPSLVNASYDGTPSLIRSLFLFPDVTNPWLNVGWSLIYEMWFYLLLGSLLLFRKQLAIAVLGSYALFLLLAGGTYETWPAIKLITDPLVLEFLLGFSLGAVYFGEKFPHKRFTLVIVSAISLLLILASLEYDISISNSPWGRLISFGLPALSTVAFALSLDTYIGRSTILKPIIYLGTVSYSVYLTHVFFLNAFLFTLLRILKLEISMIAANIACFAFVLYAGKLYYHLVEKTTTKQFMKMLQRQSN